MNGSFVAITGADGFIGGALCARFIATGRPFKGLVRALNAETKALPQFVAVGDLATIDEAALTQHLQGAHAIVHLAGRAHVPNEKPGDAEETYRQANVVATERIARVAVRIGVRRFLLASTVKVHGERSEETPLKPDDRAAPEDAYARSKLEAERALTRVMHASHTTPLILRLPLVYGPRAKGNFRLLLEAVASGRWLPLGAIRSRRSILYVGNLVDAIEKILDAPRVPIATWIVADQPAVTAAGIARGLAAALGVRSRLASVPVPLLRLYGALFGKQASVQRLTTPLEVDTSAFAQALRWRSRYTLDEGFAATADWWRKRQPPPK